MAKSSVSASVSKLVPKVPGVPSPRRPDFSASTKRGLVAVAEQLFTEQGYSATSLDSIVAGAEVTKGALYHHFSGKQALFEAVFETVEDDATRAIKAALRTTKEPWEKAIAGLQAFLLVVQDPRYRRIVVQDGPAVLGYERYREQEERSTFALVMEIVRSTLDAGTWELEEDMLQTFARIFFGALSAAGDTVAGADDPLAAADRVETALRFIIAGLQTLADADVGLADVDLRLAQGLDRG
ncbi:TetR/AcrR family transcriptional regulator [Nocardioides acrostichi]|uniref:TetR/AcrR family transcriptional regulator n=1 Tax=Nocardioides acrostichi TaxID=2784339 RepID=A0A930USJ0_9ACTN|nr:TetR/AcrR family transcriptional regulator [Nocardioides acrostichi]MBF4160068.1 TetR/AcrR family transcriptional regulator [Nocardioides acrostichi]